MANELNSSKTKAIYLSTKKHTNTPIVSQILFHHIYSLFGNAQEKTGFEEKS